jgi:hypothetical protein
MKYHHFFINSVFYALFSLVLVTGCFPIIRDDDYTPRTVHDGVFSFDYNGTRYRQSINGSYCSAYAMCHPALDTLIISGGVAVGDNQCPIERIIFVFVLDDAISNDTISLKCDETIIQMRMKETIDGLVHQWSQYLSVEGATVTFDDFLDASKENQYISGYFDIPEFKWKDNRIKVSDGLFKFWVEIEEHHFGYSASPYGYDIINSSSSFSY